MSTLKKEHRDRSGLELLKICVQEAEEFKAEDLMILDVRGVSSFTDYFLIMSGRSTRHVQGIAEAIADKLRSKRVTGKNCEGLREGQWVLLDFSDVVVHIFYRESREFYDIEGLWHDAPRIPLESLENPGNDESPVINQQTGS